MGPVLGFNGQRAEGPVGRKGTVGDVQQGVGRFGFQTDPGAGSDKVRERSARRIEMDRIGHLFRDPLVAENEAPFGVKEAETDMDCGDRVQKVSVLVDLDHGRRQLGPDFHVFAAFQPMRRDGDPFTVAGLKNEGLGEFPMAGEACR